MLTDEFLGAGMLKKMLWRGCFSIVFVFLCWGRSMQANYLRMSEAEMDAEIVRLNNILDLARKAEEKEKQILFEEERGRKLKLEKDEVDKECVELKHKLSVRKEQARQFWIKAQNELVAWIAATGNVLQEAEKQRTAMIQNSAELEKAKVILKQNIATMKERIATIKQALKAWEDANL